MHEIGILEESKCDYCNAEVASFDHLVWQCPLFHDIRVAVDKNIAEADKSNWGAAVRRGGGPGHVRMPGYDFLGKVHTAVEQQAGGNSWSHES